MFAWLALAAVPPEDVRAFAEAVDHACGATGLKQEWVAEVGLRVKPQQLDQWKRGERNPNWFKFYNLRREPSGDGLRWLEAFLGFSTRSLGLPEITTALQLQRLVLDAVRPQMAKASLASMNREEIAV